MSGPAVGTIIADKYRVESVLGEGGMGVVVRATHLVLQQSVAIKFLRSRENVDADTVRQFVGEAQVAARVQGDHVVKIHDVALLPDGTPYIVMEHLEGLTLAAILADRGALSVRESVRYGSQICEALVEAHAAGIVHGDLKPENIYIVGGGDTPRRVKLFDFGISRILNGSGSGERGVIVGTPAYMAPEQFEGAAEVGSDLWAVGVLIYEMLNGLPPFRGDTFEKTREQVRGGRATPLGRLDMPAGLNDIIAHCLEKAPAARYANAMDLASALEEYLPVESSIERYQRVAMRGKQNTSQRVAPTVILPDRKKGQGTWGVAALGLVVVVGLVVALLIARARSHPAPSADTVAAKAPPSAPPSVSGREPPSLSIEPSTAPPEPTASVVPVSPSPSISASPSTSTSATAPSPSLKVAPRKRHPRPAASDGRGPASDDDRFGTRK
jgi:serine/threonine-protein kinase